MNRFYEILNSLNINIKSQAEDYTPTEQEENESPEQELIEYQNDFYQMSVGSLKAIMAHSQAIISALENPSVRENLTESWLQGKIAITEDYMRTIHDFVMFVTEGKIKADSYTTEIDDDEYEDEDEDDVDENDTVSALEALKKAHSCAGIMIEKVAEPEVTTRLTSAWKQGKIDSACKSMGELHDYVMNLSDKTLISKERNDDTNSASRPGLWDNIRKKKEREGKKYRPAQPGDKDRPDPDQWKKLTKN